MTDDNKGGGVFLQPYDLLDSHSLWLCEAWATGTTDDGWDITLDRAGSTVILTLTKGEDRVKAAMSVTDLVEAWSDTLLAVTGRRGSE